jgi:hypothetical protein
MQLPDTQQHSLLCGNQQLQKGMTAQWQHMQQQLHLRFLHTKLITIIITAGP